MNLTLAVTIMNNIRAIMIGLCIFLALSLYPLLAQEYNLPLAGEWRFALDPKKEGEAQEWFKAPLPDTIPLPGTIALNKKGPQASFHENVEELSSEYPYKGMAWYQRTILIPEEWRGRGVELFVERTKLSKAWVDDHCLGEHDEIGTPQTYPLGELSPGPHRLTILVDSRVPAGVSGHMANSATQTQWNGLIGDIHLSVHDLVRIGLIRVVPEVSKQRVMVTVCVKNGTDKQQHGQVTLVASPLASPEGTHPMPMTASSAFAAEPGETKLSLPLPLGADAQRWDEFHPALYRLEVKLKTETASGKASSDTRSLEFGLREFGAKGSQFTINGHPTMLRGKHDALVFPLTGYPPMDEEAWTRVFTTAKSYGINHYRFHSCVPPEASFKAADRVGIYLQPELYKSGGNYSDEAYDYNLTEAKRILDTYGNHPSFVMFSLGNEIARGRANRAKAIAALREYDPTRLYAQGSNNEFPRPVLAEGDDYWTTVRTPGESLAHAVRGSFSHADKPLGHIQRLRPSTMYDYREAIAGIPVPVIGHEVGQYEVFPDFREIASYTGVQKPWNFQVFRSRLESAGMLDQAEAFTAASGALAVQCYREEIEAALRTPGFGGFQLLDLQDYPGQGTALVGILNAFMESKGLITPEAWRSFCGPVVPLARMESYTWTTDQTFSARIEVAQYGPADLPDIALGWELKDSHGATVAKGDLPRRDYPRGSLVDAGTISIALSGLAAPGRYELKLSLGTTGYSNEYPLWVYPAKLENPVPPKVVIREVWDQETESLLQAGKTVLLIPASKQTPGVEGFFAPDFWSYPMFRSICEGHKLPLAPGTLGLLIDSTHPALASFPTETHSNWQWWDLLDESRAMVLDATPAEFRPIVQAIDNTQRNHKLGYLFEARVGKGRLIVCSLNLLKNQQSPVVRQMLHSLLDYAGSAFEPKIQLPARTVSAVLGQSAGSIEKKGGGSYNEFFERKE
jgi:hypothetical protein